MTQSTAMTHHAAVTRFASKVDAWLIVLLLASMLASLVGMVVIAGQSAWPFMWLLLLVLGGVGVGLPLWLLLATDYKVDQRDLRIRCGPVRQRIPVADIRSVAPSRSLLSSPALSLDRLCIRYGRTGKVQGEVLVSPKDKQAFVQALQAVNPAIIHKEQE